MKNRQFLFILIGIIVVTAGVAVGSLFAVQALSASPLQTESVALDPVSPTVTADGVVHSENEATLHFQTGGKLTYLPYKEGDKVTQGATIAQLDTYALQRNLQLAANAYEIAKNSNDQTQENQQAGVLEGQQRTSLDTTNKSGYSSVTEAQTVTDAVQRIVDNSLLNQDTAQLDVDLANYALQLATLSAPFSGVITNEDVTTANQNVTPVTSFSIADPTALVFRANVLANDIDFVSLDAPATIQIDGQEQAYHGTVSKIYPDKTTLSDGEQVYQVDIASTDLSTVAKLSQSGSVTIQSNTKANVTMVPTWTVLNHNALWVVENDKPVLKSVTLGNVHGDRIEVTGGLSDGDRIITNPMDIAKLQYQLL